MCQSRQSLLIAYSGFVKEFGRQPIADWLQRNDMENLLRPGSFYGRIRGLREGNVSVVSVSLLARVGIQLHYITG